VELAADVVDSLLDRWPVARLASVSPNGRPHSVPIVFARVGELLWSPVDGKPKRAGGGGELARVRNVEARPEVALLLDDYSQDWARLWWLRLDAVGRVVRADAPDAPEIAPALEALRRKYPQYQATPVVADAPVLLAFEPYAVRSWCASEELVP
jgi:PPOX class probable F420-dependent enzyme